MVASIPWVTAEAALRRSRVVSVGVVLSVTLVIRSVMSLRNMVTLKRRLSTDTLTVDQRAKLQAEYNDLLTKYFSLKTP